MLENCKTAKQRWGGVSEIIDRWLQERQELLVKYCALSADSNPDSAAPRLQALCQILVDYVSAGHFEIYEKLIQEGREFDDQAALRQGADLYREIDATTELALDFNDKYLETDDLAQLELDLSRLGEVLESRFSAEDKMIEVLHFAHKDLIV
jgi:regulator of sigma D